MRMKIQSVKLREQERKIQEQSAKIQDQENSIADMKKHIEEWDQKFSDLTAELVRAREEIMAKIPNQADKNLPAPSTSKIYRTNIKPRTAQILPLCTLPPLDQERKRKSTVAFDLAGKIPKICDDQEESILNEQLLLDPVVLVKNIIPDKNIRNIRHSAPAKEKDESSKKPTLEIGGFLSNSLESIFKSPISGIKSRKRKSNEELDLKLASGTGQDKFKLKSN